MLDGINEKKNCSFQQKIMSDCILCYVGNMNRVSQNSSLFRRLLHTLSRDDGPSETLKKKVPEIERTRKRRNPKKAQLFVEVPESRSFLDTATLPMYLAVAGIALFAKLLMMHDESKSQEMIERKIKNAPPGQGTIRMLTREEWEEIREVRPRTPFESKLARPHAKIRTGEPLHMEDMKNWTIDVLTDALTRAENCSKHK
ncbi:hypothetical protein ES288_A01G048300v1 [Gossypium darwinii]|uniref:Cytoplasmic dynein 2 light intermediate chain 1 n=1 Tax=Gossypium darwinii TaxID=34276 RepID=A0A5D2HIB3_GOSDA|nr:hypothetical protein ES288_A01G048300v1 [Gossypium darwinii]